MFRKYLLGLLTFLTVFLSLPQAHASYYADNSMKPSPVATYATSTGLYTPVASTTDTLVGTGSATKTVEILKIFLTYQYDQGSSTLTYSSRFHVLKRSTANTGGTPTTDSSVPLDSNNAAATAVIKHYPTGSNPTTGTQVSGIISTASMVNGTGTGIMVPIFDADKYGQPIILRGTSESFVVNLNGNGVSASVGGLIGFTVIHRER